MKKFNSLLLTFGILISAFYSQAQINSSLEQTTEKLIADFENIDPDRKKEIEELGHFMAEQLNDQENFNALFVCTHNSRRSHLADLWFKYGMYYYGIKQFKSYSGGTEATAFNPKAIEAVRRAGFTVMYDNETKNPFVYISPQSVPVWNMKSKVYSDDLNPKSNFVAVMVCSDADKSCPFVEGAVGRFALTFKDPRHYDGTPAEEMKYDETVHRIGTEMMYLTQYLKDQLILQNK